MFRTKPDISIAGLNRLVSEIENGAFKKRNFYQDRLRGVIMVSEREIKAWYDQRHLSFGENA